MKSKRIYIVAVESGGMTIISQEAYFSFESAKRFIMSRSDKPQEITPYRYESRNTIYKIHDVLAQQ